MINKELYTIEQVRQSKIVFDSLDIMYKIDGRSFIYDKTKMRWYEKLGEFKRDYIESKENAEIAIYKHLNNDFVSAVEEARNNAVKSLKTLSKVEELILIGKTNEALIEIARHKEIYNKVKF